MERKSEFSPRIAILPGSILKLELEERGIKQKDFASKIGIPASNLNEYIHGKRSFTIEFSLKLENALNIPASNWMNLQQNYNLTLARQQHIRNNPDLRWEEADEDMSLASFLYDDPEPTGIARIFRDHPELNVSPIARRMGIKQSLLAAYISGNKKPSKKREKEILDTVKQIGQELIDAAVS